MEGWGACVRVCVCVYVCVCERERNESKESVNTGGERARDNRDQQTRF